MKPISFSVLLLPALLFGVAASAAAEHDRGVTVFRDANLRGGNESFHGDVADLSRTRVGGDRVSSIAVPVGCRVRLYADVNFRGDRIELNTDVRDLARTPFGNDRVSSLKVRCGWADDWGDEGPRGSEPRGSQPRGTEPRGGYEGDGRTGRYGDDDRYQNTGRAGVVLFRDARFNGRDEGFREGDYPDLSRTAVGNDAASSIEVRRGCRARLFRDTDFRGEYEEIDRDVSDLRDTRIGSDRASSLRVRCDGRADWGEYSRQGGVILYADRNFNGNTERFEFDIPNLGDTRFGNDRATSIEVDRGCRVRLYEDTGYRGRSIELSTDERDLSATAIGNDRVSSLQIRCGR